MKKLTIIVQTYNREKGLRKNLEALEKQSDMNFNLLIFNNGASYNVERILDDYPNLSDLVEIVNSDKNKGLVFGRNQSVKHVKTEYFARIDDDDYATNDYVKNTNELIKSNYDLILVSVENNKNEFRDKHVFSWEPWRYIIKTKYFVPYPDILPEDFLSIFYYTSIAEKISFNKVKINLGNPQDFYKSHAFSQNYSEYAYFWINKIRNVKRFLDFNLSITYQPKWMSKLVKSYADLKVFCLYDELINLCKWYKSSNSKDERQFYLNRYKEIKNSIRPKLSNRIIWSQLFVLLKFKRRNRRGWENE